MNDTRSSQSDDSQPMSLRERKKRLAQATIEEAALRLFQQRGYERTSIQDIADAVMMSSRTFFRYFASKEEVLLGPMRTILSDGLRFLQRVAPTASPQARSTCHPRSHLSLQRYLSVAALTRRCSILSWQIDTALSAFSGCTSARGLFPRHIRASR